MMALETQYGVVLVTAPSVEEAKAIASALVNTHLAACVSITPVHSIYTWQGEVNAEDEWQLVIKTDLSLFPNLEAKIRELHPYTVPEIIALPIVAGSHEYLKWIFENTNS